MNTSNHSSNYRCEKDNPTIHEHYVPQFYLKKFASGDDQKSILAFHKTRETIQQVAIRDICVTKNLYENKIQNEFYLRNLIENGLSRWEGCFSERLNSIIEKIESNTKPNELIASHEDEFWIHYMMFLQILRLPNMFEKVPASFADICNNLDFDDNKKYQHLFKAFSLGLLKYDDEMPDPPIFTLADRFQKNNSVVFLRLTRNSHEEFLVSDSPVVFAHPSCWGLFKTTENPEAFTFYYPLSCTTAVISAPRDLCPIHIRNRALYFESEQGNCLQLKSANRFLLGRTITEDIVKHLIV